MTKVVVEEEPAVKNRCWFCDKEIDEGDFCPLPKHCRARYRSEMMFWNDHDPATGEPRGL